jgi:hypothetical protein
MFRDKFPWILVSVRPICNKSQSGILAISASVKKTTTFGIVCSGRRQELCTDADGEALTEVHGCFGRGFLDENA